MGAIGAHHGHSYALQFLAFLGTLLFPGGLLILLAGSLYEQARRRAGWFLPSKD